MGKLFCRLESLIDERNLELARSKKARLNQSKIARDTAIAKTTINRLFNNRFDRVDRNTIETLCSYFDCEVGDLFKMQEE